MIPRLEAAEKLAGIEVAALAAPAQPDAMLDRQSAISALIDRASGDDQLRPAPATPGDLAGMGIALVIEDAPQGQAAGADDHG